MGANMKTCPVCQARTFDDALVCYGCLHRFEGDGDKPQAEGPSVSPDSNLETSEAIVAHTSNPVQSSCDCPPVGGVVAAFPPSFLITLTPPVSENDSSWRCAVEVVGP